MKPFKTLCALILGALSLFLITSANAVGCSFNTEKKSEIEYFSDHENCIDPKEKELPYKVEA